MFLNQWCDIFLFLRFGQLSNDMFRACRLVVDTGLHSFGWTAEKAVQFMFENSAMTKNMVEVPMNTYSHIRIASSSLYPILVWSSSLHHVARPSMCLQNRPTQVSGAEEEGRNCSWQEVQLERIPRSCATFLRTNVFDGARCRCVRSESESCRWFVNSESDEVSVFWDI